MILLTHFLLQAFHFVFKRLCVLCFPLGSGLCLLVSVLDVLKWGNPNQVKILAMSGIEALAPQRLQIVTLCQVFPVVRSKSLRLIPDRLLWEAKEFDRSFLFQGSHLLVVDL